jgi:hypothetical protein
MNVLGRTTALGGTNASQHGFNHLLAQDQQRRQRPNAGSADPIAPCFANPLRQRLAPQLAQVVSGFAVPIGRHRSPLLRPHSLGQVCGTEALGLGSQRDHRFGYRSHPRLLQVHTRHAPRAPPKKKKPNSKTKITARLRKWTTPKLTASTRKRQGEDTLNMIVPRIVNGARRKSIGKKFGQMREEKNHKH